MKKPRFRLAVLASGEGTNLQALIDACAAPEYPAEVALVASNKPTAPALRRAAAAGIPHAALSLKAFSDRPAFDRAMFDRVAEAAPDLVVLAGYLHVIAPAVLASWVGRVINIHPSLLPRHPGLRTHAAALAAGDRVHGASVHVVTADLDAGPVIAQVQVPIEPRDTPETLAARVLAREHPLLVESVRWIAEGRLALRDDAIGLDGGLVTTPLRLNASDRLVRD